MSASDAPRHVAVLLSDRAYMSSVGVIVDAVAMVATQVQRQHRQPMQTRARLLGYRTDAVRMTGDVPLATDGRIDRRESFRLVYLPAFDIVDDAEVAERLHNASGILPWLQRQRNDGAVLAAAGNAVLLLAESGLLDGGRASVPRALVPAFRRRYSRRVQVETRSAVVERDGVVFTAATPAAEWSLAVHAIEAAISPQMSTWLAVRSGLRRTGGGDRLADDPLVASAQFWLGERYGEPELSIAALAQHLAVSHATLVRRFARSIGMTPRSYLRGLRVDAAKRMLETTSRSVQQVALMVGYADARAFRSVFVEMTGTNPTAWRRGRQ
jgi:transcriptional regulator GlxA family with amidase domain